MTLSQRIALSFGETHAVLCTGTDEGVVSFAHLEYFGKFLAWFGRQAFVWKKNVPQQFDSFYKNGSIQDTQLFGAYLSFLFGHMLHGAHFFTTVSVVCVVSPWASPLEKELWYESLRISGCSAVTFCSRPIAGLVGIGHSFPISSYSLCIDLGDEESYCASVFYDSTKSVEPLLISTKYLKELVGLTFFSTSRSLLRDPKTQVFFNNLATYACAGSLQEAQQSGVSIPQKIQESVDPQALYSLCALTLSQSIVQLRAILSTQNAQELQAMTTQGISLFGRIGHLSGLAVRLSTALGIPVFAAGSTDEESFLRGALVVADQARSYEA